MSEETCRPQSTNGNWGPSSYSNAIDGARATRNDTHSKHRCPPFVKVGVYFRYLCRVLGVVGDLVEDLVVSMGRGSGSIAVPGRAGLRQIQVNFATDTPVVIERRQGGSAANVAVAFAALGQPARFIGQVGDDALGRDLGHQLVQAGVEVVLRRQGRTGTVIVMCDDHGERSMLTDRGASVLLDRPEPVWLDRLSRLHLPLYSLVGEPLATTALILARWARERGQAVSIDLSSTALLADLAPGRLSEILSEIAPSVVLADEAEAELGASQAELVVPGRLLVIKRGPAPALVHQGSGRPMAVPALDLGPVSDTTGAGDAFGAGLLDALSRGADALAAVAAGHRAAARRLAAQHHRPD